MLSGKYNNDGKFVMKISVEDSGRGIRKDELDTLFDAFYRADRKRNRSIEGTGLGLAIVKNILDAMGGEIRVESDYGKGSKFTVTIPVGVYDKTPVKDDFTNDGECSDGIGQDDVIHFVATQLEIIDLAQKFMGELSNTGSPAASR